MTSSDVFCISCRGSKVERVCGLCQEPLCRSCSIFLDEGTFAFREAPHPDLKHSYFCAPCHQMRVEPEIEAYNDVMERAREVYFFFGTSRHPIPVLDKAKVGVQVQGCMDRDETILRLGFKAAELGFNAILEGEVLHEKQRNHGWQKTLWRGKGIPAQVDPERMEQGAGDRGPRRR